MKALEEKPPFVTGIVHHSIGSPYNSESNCVVARTRSKLLSQKIGLQNINKGLHSNPSTAKCLFEAAGARVAAKGSVSALEPPQKSSKMCEEVKMERDHGKCEVTVNTDVNKSQSCTFTPTNRGGGAETNNFIPEDKENWHENKNEVNVTGYREELNRVVAELESACNEWMHLSAEMNRIPEDIVELINIAIGQTKLLIKEKLHQYRGLINECAFSIGPHKVTEDDIRGFWDMVSIQVRDVQSKFEHLVTLKQNDWNEPERMVKTSVPKRKSGAKRSNIKIVKSSSIREHIAAMRKLKKVMEEERRNSPLQENPLVTMCNGGTKSIY